MKQPGIILQLGNDKPSVKNVNHKIVYIRLVKYMYQL